MKKCKDENINHQSATSINWQQDAKRTLATAGPFIDWRATAQCRAFKGLVLGDLSILFVTRFSAERIKMKDFWK